MCGLNIGNQSLLTLDLRYKMCKSRNQNNVCMETHKLCINCFESNNIHLYNCIDYPLTLDFLLQDIIGILYQSCKFNIGVDILKYIKIYINTIFPEFHKIDFCKRSDHLSILLLLDIKYIYLDPNIPNIIQNTAYNWYLVHNTHSYKDKELCQNFQLRPYLLHNLSKMTHQHNQSKTLYIMNKYMRYPSNSSKGTHNYSKQYSKFQVPYMICIYHLSILHNQGQ